MKQLNHFLYSLNQDVNVATFPQFNKQAIKDAIVSHLTSNPTDTVEHSKELSKADAKKYVGHDILNFYEINPKTGEPSKVIQVRDRKYYQPLN